MSKRQSTIVFAVIVILAIFVIVIASPHRGGQANSGLDMVAKETVIINYDSYHHDMPAVELVNYSDYAVTVQSVTINGKPAIAFQPISLEQGQATKIILLGGHLVTMRVETDHGALAWDFRQS